MITSLTGSSAKLLPRFLFRLDVSPHVGIGHLRRCLTLALEMKRRGAVVFFLCRTESMDLSRYLGPIATDWAICNWFLTPEEDAREVVRYYKRYRIDSAIVDHYRADESYQKILFESSTKWLQFDGAAHYPFWADWVVNMSPVANATLYKPLKRRKETRFLLGPDYAPLRSEFSQWRSRVKFGGTVQKILLTFGGGDDRGATIFCLGAIRPIGNDIERIILVSSVNPYKDDILGWCQKEESNIKVVIDAEETAPYMASADLVITAGGMTTFETAALGIPALILQIADNQVAITKAWQLHGYGVDLGSLHALSPANLMREVISLMLDSECRKAMSIAGRNMVDALGARRVAEDLFPV